MTFWEHFGDLGSSARHLGLSALVVEHKSFGIEHTRLSILLQETFSILDLVFNLPLGL
jgi:hypothetical protein